MNTPDTKEPPFIYSPQDRATGATRTLHGVLTLAAWMVYAYLWLPLLTVLAWVLGIRTSYIELYVRHNQVDQGMFLVLLALAIVATLLLVGWAEYNRHKFGGHDRRFAPDDVTDHDVAESLFAPAELTHSLAHAKSVTLAMGADARPTGIHRHTPMQFPPAR